MCHGINKSCLKVYTQSVSWHILKKNPTVGLKECQVLESKIDVYLFLLNGSYDYRMKVAY